MDYMYIAWIQNPSFSTNDIIIHGITAFGHIGKMVYWSAESRSPLSFLQLMHQSIETPASQPHDLTGNLTLATC